MISNYNLTCDYHNFELKDKIYLIPDYALKVIYTDGFNEVVFSGNSANVTILEGYDISFQEETSFDERFRFSKSVSIKVNGYKTFNDLDYRYCVVLETKEGEFYLVNVDFPSFVTHTYSLANGTNATELVFSSQSNIATLKLTNFEPNNVNSCKEYSIPKIKNVKLTEAWASYLSTWQKSLVNKGEFVDIEPLPDSISLTEEFDGEKYTVTLGFDIPMSYYKNDWHLKLLQFEENKYRGYIELEDGNVAFVGYNVGLFPSYTINGDIISIRLTETAIRGIAYGNDYVLIDTNMPNIIEYNGASCYTYNWLSTCDWHVEDKPDYITISPTSGQADTQYELTICNTDDETGYAVSEFIIKSCRANARAEVIIENPIFRWINTQETICAEITNERWVESGTTCAGTHGVDKWVNSVKLVSYDDGETWYDSGVESATTLIESNSPDCGFRTRSISTGYTCVGVDKYELIENQESYDYGSTWITLSSTTGSLIEANSEDCGYTPPLPFNGKYKLTLNDSTVITAECDSLSAVTEDELAPYSETLVKAEIGDCATKIVGVSGAFEYFTGLTSVVISDSVTKIGHDTFYFCSSLTSVTIPNSVTSIGEYAFSKCRSLSSATIGNGITSISNYLFKDCSSLTSVTIPNSVTSIGNAAFADCSGLTSVTIPDRVTSIGEYAFSDCAELRNVFCFATTPPTLTNYSLRLPFRNTPIANELGYIYVPAGSVSAYKSAWGWSTYASQIQAIP